MINIRKSNERGHAEHGWLKSYHTFSFADYQDPKFMGFRSLRVINEDWIASGQGFGAHPHRDMEIITFVVEGALEHKDSMGNGDTIRPGEIQVMSAGTGVVHSEFNHSTNDTVHLLQIWIQPDRRGLKPTYQQKTFSPEQRRDKLCLLASNEKNGAAKINQDAKLFTAALSGKQKIAYSLDSSRHAWLQTVKGSVNVNGKTLGPGDGAAISEEKELEISSKDAAELLLFDLA
jgi:redox-sensitive bicupin YhaK (pirin superfamily)